MMHPLMYPLAFLFLAFFVHSVFYHWMTFFKYCMKTVCSLYEVFSYQSRDALLHRMP